MQRGIGRLRAGGGGGNPAAAWAAAVTANGGTYSAGTLTAVTNFVASARASGYWSKLNRINLFCGDQLAAALVPLKVGGGSATETNVNFVGGDYAETTGLTGNGTSKYLNTGLIPSASLTLNDTHLAVYNRAASAAGGGAHLGAQNAAAATALVFFAPYTDGGFYGDAYDSGAELVSSVLAAPYRLAVDSRTSSTAHTLYRDGSSVATTAAASTGALPSVALFVGTKNTNGTPGFFVSHPMGGYSIGSGLTAGDVTAYNTHMTTFQTALGRNV